MKKTGLCAFLLMTTFAAAGLCEMDYTLANPHIRYEKLEDVQRESGEGISISDMAAAQEVQQQAAQDADTWPKTFTITLGGDTTLGSTDDLRKREDCFESRGGEGIRLVFLRPANPVRDGRHDAHQF